MTEEQIKADFISNKEFASDLMLRMKLANNLSGINLGQALWVHHRLRALDITISQEIADQFPGSGLSSVVGVPLKMDLMNLVISGDLEVAYICLLAAEPDSGLSSYHFLVAEALAWIRHEVGVYLGWE